jgi:predicted ribonuclease YlaK
LARRLFGEHNYNLLRIADAVGVRISARGSEVLIEGDPIETDLARNILSQLYALLVEGYPVYPNDVDYAVRVLSGNDRARLKDIFLDTVYITAKKRAITPKSLSQKKYIDAIRAYDIVFGIGPAGTGKTYLAMAMAVSALTKNQVNRIILTRPAVEAGEALGFLPGDLEEKLSPWMQPIFDNVELLLGAVEEGSKRKRGYKELVDLGLLEIEALTYIRGRSIPKQYMIVDEAQNLTPHEIKTIVTRAGEGTKIILTGDPYQIDNPYIDSASNGLTYVVEKFKGEEIAGHVTLTKGERSCLAELAANLL